MNEITNIIEDLEFRGLIYQTTQRDLLEKRLSSGMTTLYCGFDPTADSLHIGSMLPVLNLRRFQMAGHRPIAVVGGATGMIGDPSGKSEERKLNSLEIIEHNLKGIQKQLERFIDFGKGSNSALLVNNYDWCGKISFLDFLRDIGKHFSVSQMIAKDSVKSRLETGISFTEFTYQILQSYDFLHLNKTYNCELQIGGQDQWGNMVGGMELIRRVSGKDSHVLTFPLVTKSDGKKFGKSESGNIWLDPNKTSPYKMYQFCLNVDDGDAVKFLKYFTFMQEKEIIEIENEFNKAKEQRLAQKTFASSIVELIHGKDALNRSLKITDHLFSGEIKALSELEIQEGLSDVPTINISGKSEEKLLEICALPEISKSKRQAREDIQNGAISINGEKCVSVEKLISADEKLFGKFTIIKRGKKNYTLINWS